MILLMSRDRNLSTLHLCRSRSWFEFFQGMNAGRGQNDSWTIDYWFRGAFDTFFMNSATNRILQIRVEEFVVGIEGKFKWDPWAFDKTV